MATFAEERKAAAARRQSEIEKALARALKDAGVVLSRVRFAGPVTPAHLDAAIERIAEALEAHERS